MDNEIGVSEAEMIKVIDHQQIENMLDKRKMQVCNGAIIYIAYKVLFSVWIQRNGLFALIANIKVWSDIVICIVLIVLQKTKRAKNAIYFFLLVTMCSGTLHRFTE